MSDKSRLYDYVKNRIQEDGEYQLSLAEYVRPFIQKGEEVIISGTGTSMLPTIDNKCKLILSPIDTQNIRKGDILLYTRTNGRSIIHRVWDVRDTDLDMIGDNHLQIEQHIAKDSVVAQVRMIIYPDGQQKGAHRSPTMMRLHLLKKKIGYILRKVFKFIF